MPVLRAAHRLWGSLDHKGQVYFLIKEKIFNDRWLYTAPASVSSVFNSRLAVGVVSYLEETYQTISPLLQIISSCVSVCVTHVRTCSCTQVSIYVGVCVSIKLKLHSSITVHLIFGDSISPYPWGFPTRLGWLTRKLQRSVCLCLASIQILMLRGKYFTYWAISPVTIIIFEFFFKKCLFSFLVSVLVCITA